MKNKNLYQDLIDYKANNPTEGHGYAGTFTYGWTPHKSYKAVMEEVKGNFKRFIVGGCSIGWMNFYWNEKNPNIKTIGLDLHDIRLAYGNFLLEKYELSNIDIHKQDIFDFEFKKGDLVWLNNLLFPKDLSKELLDKLIELDVSIVSYTSINGPNVTRIKQKVSWQNNQNFYIRNE